MIKKQLKAIRQLAVKFYDKDPGHFQAVIEEIDNALEGIEADNNAYLEALEMTDESEQVNLRDLAS